MDIPEIKWLLLKPATWIKGNKMGFAGLKKEKDRASVILYLNKCLITLYHYLNLSKQYNNILFCTCTLLRACIHTLEDFYVKKTSSDTSISLGKQCNRKNCIFRKRHKFRVYFKVRKISKFFFNVYFVIHGYYFIS